MTTRRQLLAGMAVLGATACGRNSTTGGIVTGPTASPPPSPMPSSTSSPVTLPSMFDDIERRTFDFFWNTANPANGLVPDRWPTESFCSIAAVGFALTAYVVGVERGFISRDQVADRVLTTLRFFDTAPQGDSETGVSGYKGFFYHFLDMKTGLRFQQVELSSVDTALLHLGILHVGAWFDADNAKESEIRTLSERIVARAEWPWFQHTDGSISMGWHPSQGFLQSSWTGYNEGMMVVLLALGSSGHPIGDNGWDVWTSTYPSFWRGSGDTRRIAFAPLFGHQYSQMWIDFRGIQDKVMRDAGFDYFENSRRETYAHRAYCTSNPMGWDGYSADIWGLTACDGPAGIKIGERQYYSYSARGPIDEPDGRDDGTIAPTAALGSLAFAPEIVVPCALAMRSQYGDHIYGQYGFFDSFNPSFRGPEAKATKGTVDAALGWADNDYLGIDQGPIIGAIANCRDGGIWRAMRGSKVIQRGLKRAGFTGGWIDQVSL